MRKKALAMKEKRTFSSSSAAVQPSPPSFISDEDFLKEWDEKFERLFGEYKFSEKTLFQ
jgi:hypothetical protein